MSKLTFATVWLDGCSGCHMSFLDLDQRLIELGDAVEVVYSPLVDNKEFPIGVDITLVEGAVSSEEDRDKITMIRQRTKTLVSLGDCAVTANVPSMRNPFKVDAVLDRAYNENVTIKSQIPNEVIPSLLPYSRPVHEVVSVDVFIPGCPPPADVIYEALTALLEGQPLDLTGKTRFGA